jgi:hypothetical protein
MKRPALRVWLCAGLVALLASCATEEDFRRADEAACTSYGFKQGTDAFAECLQRETLARRYGRLPPGMFGWYGAGWYSAPPFGMW